MAEIWDAYYVDGTSAGAELVRGEPIPEGLYHIVCEIMVRHTDGDILLMRRDLSKQIYPGAWEASAGGSALKGEDPLTCAHRELREETGIADGTFAYVDRWPFRDGGLFHGWICTTDWDKSAITLQEGETMDTRWITPEEFKTFLHTPEFLEVQRERWMDQYRKMGFVE